MLRILRKWFTPRYNNISKFEYSPSGFQKAMRWAKGQPHPFLNNLSLWDYVHNNWMDSEHKLHEINKIKQGQ